jgi:hypothetical protein
LKIAIIGASGVGKYHARNFTKFDVEVCSILSSSKTSGKATSKYLKESLDLNVNSYDNLELLIARSKPQAVVVSSPNELHYDQIIYLLDKNIPLFCEKPLFWNKADDYKTFSKKLKTISEHPNRAIFVNTSSAYYIRSIKSLLPKKKYIKLFKFKFITNGKNRFSLIAEDLLPHGLSMIIELLGYHQIYSFEEHLTRNSYVCSFIYGNCKVDFEFQEDEFVNKEFSFSINNNSYVRRQAEDLKKYQVFIDCIYQNKSIEIVDPFEIYTLEFINYCLDENINKKDGFIEASHNLNLMAKILLNRKN